MKYLISHEQYMYLEQVKAQILSMMGTELKSITKTSKFEESYSSRAFKQPVFIKKISILNDIGFRLTFRQFLKVENGEITYTRTPTDYINRMIDDAILKFRVFKSFVYKDYKTLAFVPTAAFDTLKFDLILDVDIMPDSFNIKSLQIKSYYGLMVNEPKRFCVYIKDREFANNLYFEIRYNKDGTLVDGSSLPRLIETVESIWEYELDLNNLDIDGMRTTTEMLLI